MIEAHVKIARDGKTLGEYSLSDLGRALRSKAVLLTDHYWRPGMKEWASIEAIAKEAEEAVPTSDAPTPPRLPPSGWALFHLILSICAIIASFRVWDDGKVTSNQLSSHFGFQDHINKLREPSVDHESSSKLPASQELIFAGASKFRHSFQLFGSATLILWIITRGGYLFVISERRSADKKLIMIGDALFAGALMNVAFAAYRFLIQPGYLNCWQLIGLG